MSESYMRGCAGLITLGLAFTRNKIHNIFLMLDKQNNVYFTKYVIDYLLSTVDSLLFSLGWFGLPMVWHSEVQSATWEIKTHSSCWAQRQVIMWIKIPLFIAGWGSFDYCFIPVQTCSVGYQFETCVCVYILFCLPLVSYFYCVIYF